MPVQWRYDTMFIKERDRRNRGFLYAVYAAFSFHINVIDARTQEQEVVVWDDEMEKTQEDGVYYFRRVLPLENTNEKVVVYYTMHMNLEVFIDGEKVYELKAEEDRAVKTTGFSGLFCRELLHWQVL